MNITFDAAIASIITAFIVGLITVVTTIVANGNSFRQQQAQWAREESKALREERLAEKSRDLEQKKDIINKLQEIYGNSIASLTTLLLYNDASKQSQYLKEYALNLEEVQKCLSLVAAVHYDKQSEEYAHFLRLYRGGFDSSQGYYKILELRDLMIELVSKDPRLHT